MQGQHNQLVNQDEFVGHTMAGTSGCGTASNLLNWSFRSGSMLMYAPLFSVESQYLGAEKTRNIG